MRTTDLARSTARFFRRRRALGASLAAAVPLLVMAGCLVSGQILISFDLLDPIPVTTTAVIDQDVDLTTISDYEDHKQDIDDLADVAVLGQVENTGATSANISFYMTPDFTNHATPGAVTGDPSAILVWGPFAIAAGETVKIDWDASAGLFVGRQALIDQVKSDGQFTLYALNSGGGVAATLEVSHGVLVLVIDAGL